MSRFLPTVVTAKTLRDLGLQPADIMGRVFGGIETSDDAATHPDGKKNLDEINQMTQASRDRLCDFQHDDGDWGWWKDDDSDHWMTAYVVWGLALARDAGVQIKDDALQRGRDYLNLHLVDEQDSYDMQAFMLHALASAPKRPDDFTRCPSRAGRCMCRRYAATAPNCASMSGTKRRDWESMNYEG